MAMYKEIAGHHISLVVSGIICFRLGFGSRFFFFFLACDVVRNSVMVQSCQLGGQGPENCSPIGRTGEVIRTSRVLVKAFDFGATPHRSDNKVVDASVVR